jgi:predicted nucleotide-binding protein
MTVSIQTALSETFGHNTAEYQRFVAGSHFNWPISLNRETPHSKKVESVAEDRLRSIQLLTAAIELLEDRAQSFASAQPATAATSQRTHSNRVFIVHGHDNETKEAVARFLETLGYTPIILHEQANKGRTIIQKFRDEASDVGFAVVLMTPDDQMPDGSFRARQNVILELGFFLGALGPDCVAAIVKGDVERPSDFDGVVYIPYDGGWKAAIGKELQAVGYSVDWNKIMR